MGSGIDVRIDPQRNRCHGAQLGCNLLQALELVGRFDVEAVHADFQRAAHVVARLANAGEHDAVRLPAGRQDALEFATRNDVEAGAKAGQYVEYAKVRVRLDGKTDQMRHALQCVGIGAVLCLDMCSRVDVGGGAEALRESGQRHTLREELTVAVREGLHECLLTVRIGLWNVLWQLPRRPVGKAGLSGRSR